MRKPGTLPGIARDATMSRTISPDMGNLTLLRLREVCRRTCKSRTEIYRRIAAGDFPPPVKLGERASAWPEHEVTAWIADRIAARDAKAAA